MFSKFFKKKDKFEEKISSDIEYKFIYQDDAINNICDNIYVQKACEFEEKEKNIAVRMIKNQDKVLFHSNIIMQYKFKTTVENLRELTAIYDGFLFFKMKTVEKEDWTYLILSGSIYAYRYLIKSCKDSSNKIYKSILLSMYNINKCFFRDFIEYGLMSENKFIPRQFYIEEDKLLINNPIENNVTYVNLDPVELVIERLSIELPITDLIDLISATILIQIPVMYTERIYGMKTIKYDNNKFLAPFVRSDNILKILSSVFNINGTPEEVSRIIENASYKISQIQGDEGKRMLPLGMDCVLLTTVSFKQLLEFIYNFEQSNTCADILKETAKNLKKILENNFKQFSLDLVKPRYKLIGIELEEELNIDEPLDEIKEEIINDMGNKM